MLNQMCVPADARARMDMLQRMHHELQVRESGEPFETLDTSIEMGWPTVESGTQTVLVPNSASR